MAKSPQTQNLPVDVAHLVDQLERHCLAPDGSHVSKAAFSDLQLAREEMSRERMRYLEAMAVYCEAIAVVEEYQQAVSAANIGGVKDIPILQPQLGLNCSPLASSKRQLLYQIEKNIIRAFKILYVKVCESLEHWLAVAEASQRLRLPLLSKDGEIHEEEIEKLSMISRSSIDSTSTSVTPSTNSNSTYYNNSYTNSSSGILGFTGPPSSSDIVEPGVGGVPNRFLGITPGFLWQVQQQHPVMAMDPSEYQRSLVWEIESRLKAKCEILADMFAMDDNDSSSITQISSARLPERVKLIIEEVEKEEAVLLEDLYSMDRKFAEHYNVLEQILGVLIKFVKDLKLQHQHQYDELRKTWLCKRCQTMNAKLSVLEHLLLRDTYTKDSVPALRKIRNYLIEATEEASIAYNKAVTRLREYQGVDPHFDTIARQYHDIVKKLEGMQWTIHQVEMDLKRSLDHSSS